MKESSHKHYASILVFILFASSAIISQTKTPAEVVRLEKQPFADLGNGYYTNPIVPGNYGDPTIAKVGKEYYMAFAREDGFILWHSKDIVNWEPVIRKNFKGYHRIWAVDLQYYEGKYHLYMPIFEWPQKKEESICANFVSVADKPEGPWSEPTRVDTMAINDPYYTGIDPGFIQTPVGQKYLYNDHGYVTPLSSDGLKAVGQPKLVYKGWQYPKEWVVEGECLESPKLFMKDGYYYLVSAMGGTSGPSTAHMAVVARSKTPTGPWENSPYNPLIHTYSSSEKWWQQGHATIIEGPESTWWTVYHGRLNNYEGMGRQTLLMPIEWTEGGWPRIKSNLSSADILEMPKGENIGNGMPISDDFSSEQLGIQWIVNENDLNRIKCGSNKLIVDAAGTNSKSGTILSVMANNKSYEASVTVECEDGAIAGLIFGNREGLKTDGKAISYNVGEIWRTRHTELPVSGKKVYLKIRNNKQDLAFYASNDGNNWTNFQNGARAGSYIIQLFTAGKGKAVFENFRYQGID